MMTQADPALLQRHYADAHKLGLHLDGVFHPECDICYDTAVEAYAAECVDILRASGAGDDVCADFRAHYKKQVDFDRNENGKTGIFLHDEQVYCVADFLGLVYQGDGTHTASSPEFVRLEGFADVIRARRWLYTLGHRANRSGLGAGSAECPA